MWNRIDNRNYSSRLFPGSSYVPYDAHFRITYIFVVDVVVVLKESNVSIVHFVGAFMAFGGMTVYLWMQTFISQSLPTIMFSTRRVFVFRVFLLSWSVVLGSLCKIVRGGQQIPKNVEL